MHYLRIATLFLCLPLVSHFAWGQANGVPVDPAIKVVSPPSDMRKELAAFSGKWAGSFNGVQSSAYMSDGFLVVEEIASDSDIKVYYAQVGRFRHMSGAKTSSRVSGKIVDGNLEFTTSDPMSISCSLQGSNRLACLINDTKEGYRYRGGLTRVKD